MYFNVSCIRFTDQIWGEFAANLLQTIGANLRQSYGLNCEFFSAQFYMSEKCHVNLVIIKV